MTLVRNLKLGKEYSTKPNSASKPTILVLGGYGFIGRYIVSQLEIYNVRVLVGTRVRHKYHRTIGDKKCNERYIKFHRMTNTDDWHQSLDQVDIVINAVGILRQRPGESYQAVHHHALRALASACLNQNIKLIHISALGLNNSVKSRFLSSKLSGEKALINSKADWYLVRPSLVDGKDGYGSKWFRRMAAWPVHFVPSNANGTLAPIKVSTLARAVSLIALIDHNRSSSRIFELGGAKKFKLIDYLNFLKPKHRTSGLVTVRVPAIVARLISHVCDMFHLTPFSFGHYELLKFDNYPAVNRLSEVLSYDKHINSFGFTNGKSVQNNGLRCDHIEGRRRSV